METLEKFQAVLHCPTVGQVQAAVVLEPGPELVRLRSCLDGREFMAHPDDCRKCEDLLAARRLARDFYRIER